jgi:hypothetical protein
MKLLTVASKLDEKGLDNLVMSAQKFGWDIEVICTEWRGFGTKLIEVYNYFKQNPDVKELIFVDAYDVLVLSTPKEVEEKIKDGTKMLVSVEKACYPDSNLASEYPETKNEWKYVNSGTYYAPREVFMSLFENDKPEYATDDQRWMTKQFLNNQDKINLDYDCGVFQCYSFIAEGDFEYKDGRVHNLRTLSTPSIIHSNGRTDNTKVLQLL